eukprot:TRINITY_DN10892_c0_g1_i1.p1 TRINITY_DN10892_c0_g1~~TRINITY_DN10892_c0_g1_i1.p1  ORF type:complete len:188 (-),score=19.74 TRINITY_DN10892_c0_g1_i1:76-639(-)
MAFLGREDFLINNAFHVFVLSMNIIGAVDPIVELTLIEPNSLEPAAAVSQPALASQAPNLQTKRTSSRSDLDFCGLPPERFDFYCAGRISAAVLRLSVSDSPRSTATQLGGVCIPLGNLLGDKVHKFPGLLSIDSTAVITLGIDRTFLVDTNSRSHRFDGELRLALQPLTEGSPETGTYERDTCNPV